MASHTHICAAMAIITHCSAALSLSHLIGYSSIDKDLKGKLFQSRTHEHRKGYKDAFKGEQICSAQEAVQTVAESQTLP